MTGLSILDLVVGMIFIYFLLSIICSSLIELLFAFLKTRAKLLGEWLRKIFDQPALDSQGDPLKNPDGTAISLGQAIMDHCMTTALTPKGKSTTYISGKNFVSALLDKITISPSDSATTQLPPTNLQGYIAAIENSSVISGELKRTILSYANEAKEAYAVMQAIPAAANVINTVKSELDDFRGRLEGWYNDTSDRISGNLKRKKVVPLTIIIATALTISLNVDSVRISKYLYDHKAQAKEFADNAISSLDNYKERIEHIKTLNTTEELKETESVAQLDSSLAAVKKDIADMKSQVPDDLPLGWENNSPNGWSIFGWLATILAICLGAPFWFDILNKIANLRSNGPKPSTTTDKDGK